MRDGRLPPGGNGPPGTTRLEFSRNPHIGHPFTHLLRASNGPDTVWLHASATQTPTRFYRAVAPCPRGPRLPPQCVTKPVGSPRRRSRACATAVWTAVAKLPLWPSAHARASTSSGWLYLPWMTPAGFPRTDAPLPELSPARVVPCPLSMPKVNLGIGWRRAALVLPPGQGWTPDGEAHLGWAGGDGGYPELLDGGVVMAPHVAIDGTEGEWEVENVGIAPDIEVDLDPKAGREGQDSPSGRGVAMAVEALAQHPVRPQPHPKYPVYHPPR